MVVRSTGKLPIYITCHPLSVHPRHGRINRPRFDVQQCTYASREQGAGFQRDAMLPGLTSLPS
jgi:hypothetical protein